MASLSITAANVLPGGNLLRGEGIAGEAVTRGMYLRKHTDNKYYKVQVNSEATGNCDAVALSDSSSGQPLVLGFPPGDLIVGATMTVGMVYVAGLNGAIRPVIDLTIDEVSTVLGTARTSTVMVFSPINANVLCGADIT